MKGLAFIFYSLCFATASCAQPYIEIKGKVLDQKTKQALPYASIAVKNSPLGTVSNEMGEFDFFVPVELAGDTLLVSYIGYQVYRESVSNLPESKIINLIESVTELNEVVISSDGARKLIEEALKSIPTVYPNLPYLMEGFHRSWEKIDFTDSISYPGTLIEAAVTVYDPGYIQGKGKSQEEFFINEIRRSDIMDGWNYGHGNGVKDLLDNNLIRHNETSPFVFLRSFMHFPNNMIYSWDGSIGLDDENVSVINIEAPNAQQFPAFYKVWISEVDHAILRFELSGTKNEIDYSTGPWHTQNFDEVYIFKRYKGKPYLSYARRKYTVKNLNLERKKVTRTEEYFRELLVNNLITENVDLKRKSLKEYKAKNISLARQTSSYNEDFWKHYNVIQENPLDNEILNYFKQNGKTPAQDKKRTKITH